MLRISIDGACRRNGKPNCISAGGVFIQQFGENNELLQTDTKSNYEIKSTNQRGELLALLTALDYIWSAKQPTQLITDSEYLFNTMTKDWLGSWSRKGWVTSLNEPVKNKDLLLEIKQAYDKCEAAGTEVAFYHIKGHCIPFGKVTADQKLQKDPSGLQLMRLVETKYDQVVSSKEGVLQAAQELSEKNNGFVLESSILKDFIVINVVADAIATKCVEAADALYRGPTGGGSR